ncbi:MAG TPA: protoporphyrinogen oxidase [Ilumatobacter sp.]|nr:protoporphyrinogen oxidase [Ilumatobacter sp.]
MKALVVGGGVSGLAAAVALAEAGVDTELWEAGDRVGGKLRTSPFAGLDAVDEGADAYLTRVPHGVAFATRIGLDRDDLTAPQPAHAAVWHQRLHDLPGGIVLGVPAAVRPFVTTGLLSWRGKARAALEPLLPRRAGRRPGDDDTLGALVRGRFGDEVHERLVDALVGSIYATDTDRASLAAVPQLAQLAASHRSLLLGARAARRQAPATPVADSSIFAAPRAGMAALATVAAARFVDAGGRLHVNRAAAELTADGTGWRVDGEHFDHVVLAAPARATAQLVATAAPATAELLAGVEYADIAMVRLAVPATDWPDRLAGRSGYLVPKPVQRTVTAASFGSQKWAHWRPADGSQVLRISLGRDGLPIDALDDDALLDAAVTETGRHLGLDLQPTVTSVTRWVGAFPQYRPHHHDRVAAAEAALPTGLYLAGASYHGIGVPACIASGLKAATQVTETNRSSKRVVEADDE